jgi:glycine dehydrogenase subunit 1
VSAALPPSTRRVIETFALARDIEIVEHPVAGGRTVWREDLAGRPAAVLFAQPNYLGVIEDYTAAVRLAHDRDALALVQVDPMLLGVLRSPGDAGCDVCFGEGQPLGSPMSFGGPGLGMFAVTAELLRRMPGRLVGKTVDEDGAVAYTLTLRTREQDIRREKATSNICTNQGLNAIAAAICLAWLGPGGLAELGRQSIQRAHYLADRVCRLPGVSLGIEHPFGREFPILLAVPPDRVIAAMADRGYLAGIPLEDGFCGVRGGLLVAVTEQRTRSQLDGYAAALEQVIGDA